MKQTDAIFAHVQEVHRQAAGEEQTLRLSLDGKASVPIGPFSRGGPSRTGTRGADHDFKPEGVLTPFGIFRPRTSESELFFTDSKVSSDFMADCLEEWIRERAEALKGVRKLILDLDNGPENSGQRSQWLLRMLATQTERTQLVPLIDALHARMRAEKVMDFGMQMASAARLASTLPQVGQRLRHQYRVVLLDEYQDTGHAQRVALSSLFGRGVDDDLALTAVGDPIQSIYGWRGASATNLPRFTTDFPRADGTPVPEVAAALPGTPFLKGRPRGAKSGGRVPLRIVSASAS